jgi:O-acetylserine/cysteine efflux transporter
LTFVTCCLPVPVLLIGMAHLGEQPTGLQLIGLAVALGGGLLFFSPGLGGGEWLGLGLASLGLVSFSYSSVFGRAIAREKQASTAALTGLPLVMGGAPLLLVAWLWEGAPHPSLVAWQVVIALALLNTVIAYSLYYHSMQVLTAFEANMLLNLAPLGTAVLAWYVYDERITLVQIVGMLVVIFGITLVQWRPAPPRPQTYAQTA